MITDFHRRKLRPWRRLRLSQANRRFHRKKGKAEFRHQAPRQHQAPRATGAKRSRPSTSGVWENFDRTTKQDAAGNEVPYAICKIYRHELFAKSTGGTGHLLRHATRCRTKQGLVMRQTQLQYNPDGTILKGYAGRLR